jgi:hypothetical protein
MRRFATRIATLFSAAILAGGYLYAQTVAISPGYVNLPLGGTQQYTATVTGLTPTTVTWGVTAGGGTITQTGLYTAPAVAAQEFGRHPDQRDVNGKQECLKRRLRQPGRPRPDIDGDLAEPDAGGQRHHHPHSHRHRALYQRRHRHVQWRRGDPDKVRSRPHPSSVSAYVGASPATVTRVTSIIPARGRAIRLTAAREDGQ